MGCGPARNLHEESESGQGFVEVEFCSRSGSARRSGIELVIVERGMDLWICCESLLNMRAALAGGKWSVRCTLMIGRLL